MPVNAVARPRIESVAIVAIIPSVTLLFPIVVAMDVAAGPPVTSPVSEYSGWRQIRWQCPQKASPSLLSGFNKPVRSQVPDLQGIKAGRNYTLALH